MLYFITGGQRSGKSRYAQQLALELSPSPLYIATARHWDSEFTARIDRHKADRDERWSSVEEEKHISRLDLRGKTAVMDCVTLWLTNFFTDNGQDIEKSLCEARDEIDRLVSCPCNLIVISNEIGMGLHADTETGRKFTDLHGWTNQYLAAKADKAILMVSGLPLILK